MEETKINKIAEFFKGLGALALSFILPNMAVVVIILINPKYSDAFLYNSMAIIQVVLLILFILLFRKTLKKDFLDLKENGKEKIKTGLKIWGIGLLAMMVCNLIINLYINPDGMAINEETNRSILFSFPFFAIVSMIFYAPIVEELTFRAGFKKAFNNIIHFSIFVGFLFGLAHVTTIFLEGFNFAADWKQLLYVIPYGLLGASFGYAYYKTDNIFTTISAHFVHNLVSVILLLIASFGG